MPPNCVKVDRSTKWGNYFRVGDDFGAGPIDAAEAVELFRCDPVSAHLRKAAPELRGKSLACWCLPGSPCHADVLLELANA